MYVKCNGPARRVLAFRIEERRIDPIGLNGLADARTAGRK